MDHTVLRDQKRLKNGQYDGSLGPVAVASRGTSYISDSRDYLLGQWTFGHLLGNMVSEQDDPITFYKHFVDQWNHDQEVNGWKSGKRKLDSFTGKNEPNLTLANLPFRLLAIGNRLDLFHADSIRTIHSAGEGRFVFTNTTGFDVPPSESAIWKVHDFAKGDTSRFTLIFEYGLPGKDFASLARWAKDWHKLEVKTIYKSNYEEFEKQQQ